jgi:hypothetical protein
MRERRSVSIHGTVSQLSVVGRKAKYAAPAPARHDRCKPNGPPTRPARLLKRAAALLRYIFPSVSSASRTCASVKLDDLGYF